MREDEDWRREQQRAQRTYLPPQVNPPVNPPGGAHFHSSWSATQQNCFVDVDAMLAHNACVARGTFIDAQGREILVHVPTMTFFALHSIQDNAPFLWDCLSLKQVL